MTPRLPVRPGTRVISEPVRPQGLIGDQGPDEQAIIKAEERSIVSVGKSARRIALTVIVAAGPAAFIFGQLQRFVDKTDSWIPVFIREAFPWLAATGYILLALLIRTVIAWWKLDRAQKHSGSAKEETLAQTIVEYAAALALEKKDLALLKLRAQCDYLLHTSGANEERRRLGQLALEAAARLQDRATQIEVMLDDLGWTEHLLGDPARALSFIDHAIEMAQADYASTEEVRYALLAAKGIRHRAIIVSKDHDIASLDLALDSAVALFDPIPEPKPRDVRIAYGQVDHARALGRLIHRGLVRDDSVIEKWDSQGARLIEDALGFVRSAKHRFSETKSDLRIAKALVLEERALRALGRDAEATVVAAERDRMTAETNWVLSEANRSIMGA